MSSQAPDAPPVPAFGPLFAESGTDDSSTHAHRQLIGYLGLFLPLLLWIMAVWRPIEWPKRWEHLNSISAYYYTWAVAAFVGVLVALAVFLFTYGGYKNDDRWLDRLAAVIAGIAAIGVAFFPTSAPDGVPAPSWWEPWMRTVHYVSAGVLFGSFIVFSLYLFRKSDVKKKGTRLPVEKRIRNGVYVSCGFVMLGCMVWVAGAAKSHTSIFWPEVLALEFFAVSWLVKGRAGWTLSEAGRRTRYYAAKPRRLAGDVRRTMRG